MPASLVVHSLIAALLIFGLPVSLLQPQKEEAIKVELVPPPEPKEKAKAEPPPPAKESKAEKPPEPKVEKPLQPTDDAARQEPAPEPVLRPVFQFGEKDVGPKESKDGNSAEEGSEAPAAPPDQDNQHLAETAALAALGAISQVPQPEILEAMGPAAKPAAPEAPAPKPAQAANAQKAAKLQKAKTLFSREVTGSPVATTALRNLPREVRAGTLCATELDGQLRHASYSPDRVPAYMLKSGTVLDIPDDGFPQNGQWYSLSYRCEVDAEAMKVVSFAFRVGGVVPRNQWKPRWLRVQ